MSTADRSESARPPSDALDADDDADLDSQLDAEDGILAGSLRELLRPPIDIEGRVADTVSHRLRGRSVLGSAADLLGLGARTVGLILSDDPTPADRKQDGGSTEQSEPQHTGAERGPSS